MLRKAILAAAALVALGASGGAFAADTIVLNSGKTIEGQIVEETAELVKLKLKFGTAEYKKSEIKEIRRAEAGAGVENAADLRDVVTLKSGEKKEGLLVSENEDEVVMDLIRGGANVSKNLTMRMTFEKEEIQEMKRLTDGQRAAVKSWFESLKHHEELDKFSEASLQVEKVEWPSKKKGVTIPAWVVELEHFRVEANTSQEFLRKAAYRMGKVFQAYKEHFGVETKAPGEKVRVVIFNSMAEYYAAIGQQFKNPAFYAPALKLISAGCDEAAYKAAVEAIKKYHAELNGKLEKLQETITKERAKMDAAVKDAYEKVHKKGRTTPAGKLLWDQIQDQKRQWQLQIGALEKQARDVQEQIYLQDRKNEGVYKEYTAQMFETLYHEGFHAFADNFLFPGLLQKHFPLWLNEGLAQYFEMARVEGPRLLLGKVDGRRMALLRKWKAENSLVLVHDLVVAESKHFIVQDMSDLEGSTKHYLQSWLLVYWLGEQKRLTRENLIAYVNALAGGQLSGEAIGVLAGKGTEEIQKALEGELSFGAAPPAGAKTEGGDDE